MSNQSDRGGINTQAVLAMRGAGYYSERTAGARDVINDARELVLTALETLSDAESLRLAERFYNCTPHLLAGTTIGGAKICKSQAFCIAKSLKCR